MADKQSALDELAAELQRIRATEETTSKLVLAARAAGCSWASIGATLGVTKQAAHLRYHSLEQATDRPED